MPDVLKRVGRYDLLQIIGRGGAAIVYLARQRDLERNVALKELSPSLLDDASFAERFVEESRLAGAMNHANVVTVHEFFEDGGVPYIAMEYLPYGSLRGYIGRLTTAQISGVLEGVLAGLSHGEAHGIVHRDLKPENLLVSADGRVKIADFGVARAYSQAATRAVVTVAGTTIGTPAYMSPEQALGTDLTPATDLYSLGIVAWELMTGDVPFAENGAPVAVLYQHVHEPVPPVRSVAPEVDPGIADWLARMLAKRPEDRFACADDAWLALEDAVLELLGPRWRREARLPVADGRDDQGDHTLTPARFDAERGAAGGGAAGGGAARGGAARGASGAGGAPVPETMTGLRNTPSVPHRAPPRSYTTMLRIARRHHAVADEQAPADSGTRRRRIIIAGIVLAVVVAAVAGVIAGTASLGTAGPSAAQKRAAAALALRQTDAATRAAALASADKRLEAIAQRLARSRAHALAQVRAAGSQHAQIAAATGLQGDYRTAASRAAALAQSAPAAHTLSSALQAGATAYGRVAAAVRTGSGSQWSRAWATVRAAERKVRTIVAAL